jgi:carboxyl-terminal processing protease
MLRKKGTLIVSILAAVLIFVTLVAEKPNDTLYSYIRLSSDVAFNISKRYVDDVDSKTLIYSGVKGMLDILDPFSEFLERKDYSQLQEMTTGKYSGLGMSIMQKEGVIIVVAPMEGTPAYRMGLRAGDKILKIDGKPTNGMTTEDASSLMRGPAGTKVTLSISREGVDEPLEYTLERAVIEIKTVPFYGTFDKNGKKLGYVRLARFGEEANSELETAFSDLLKQNIDGIIFDLRSNGGGLLDQAVKVANYFLPKGSEVTATKGRTLDQDRTLYASSDPMIPVGLPMAILVNEMSASASEIVAGSIQDWDRGVIIGNTTFGKGLVQQIYPLTDDAALKLTTAKWYVPSGRCIQKDSRSTRHPDMLAQEADSDSTAIDTSTVKPDSATAAKKEKEIFHTKGGRIVFGGGGVVPDVDVADTRLNALELNLERLSLFFDFSIKYTAEHPDLPEDFAVTPQIVDEFKNFLTEKKFIYKSELEADLEKLEKTIADQKKSDEYSQSLAALRRQIDLDKEHQFVESLDYLKRSIKRDILTKLYGEKAVYRQVLLQVDPYVERASNILTSTSEYAGILEPSSNKK